MYPFASYVLRAYHQASGWNEDNLYSNLTRSSNAILDFTVPKGLHFSISKSPNALFRTSYSMCAVPSLNGSVGYIFTSRKLNVKSSKDVNFKDMIDRFRIYDQPRRPEVKGSTYLTGGGTDTRDYLLYGRLYLPTGRLDALYSLRISPTLQGLIVAISDPRVPLDGQKRGRSDSPSNAMFSLQHDVGRWCTEYTWSAEDSMWGTRLLYNFGKLSAAMDSTEKEGHDVPASTRLKRVDEEDAVEGGLRGRISVGAEFYISAKERSAGVSTGVRFTTLPDATPPSIQPPGASGARDPPSQTPTTITALFNPMMGHISTAYAARVSRDLSLASRFDFNFYSYESELAVGAEWWMRHMPENVEHDLGQTSPPATPPHDPHEPPSPVSQADGVYGVVKARASTSNDVSIMWEGRIKNILVSLGVVSDFSSRAKPIKAIGLELSYFSST